MMLLLLGASGSIGSAVRGRARDQGHQLLLMSRDVARLGSLAAHETSVQADIADPATLSRAITPDLDAVISTLGPTSNTADQVPLFEAFAQTLVRSMDEVGVRRLVAVSGAACIMPGERKPLGDRVASAFVRLAVRHVVAAKQRELEVIVASDLDWILPRPVRVVDGPATGTYRLGAAARGMRINSGDLADFMVKSLNDDSCLRQAPLISD